eukprot:m.46438 g.46438  ORF g.46438 m.46438 type:complete len:124 (-) comp12537_c0_seq2:288-659(-)
MADDDGKVLDPTKKKELKQKGSALAAELDQLMKADKQREAVLSGKKIEEEPHTLYQTLFAYTSDDPDDLPFEAGEILRVFDDEGDWYEGENQQGRRGMFPRTYVRKMNVPSGGGGKKIAGVTE